MVCFGTANNIVLNFTNAALTRSPLGTSVTVTSNATFTNGIDADTSTGLFSLVTSSQDGMASDVNFTSNISTTATAVPEAISLALLGSDLVGLDLVCCKRRSV